MSLPGDEWKEGTIYEDEVDREWRLVAESFATLADSMRQASDAMRRFIDAALEAQALSQLTALGMGEVEARDRVRELRTQAAAEGRSFALLVKQELRRLVRGDTDA